MILRKQEIDLQFLGTQVLDLCPANTSNDFVEGYLNFVACFFEALDYCSEPFLIDLNPHIYEVDLSMALSDAMEELEKLTIRSSQNYSEDYWPGIDLATKNSYEILDLAYVRPSKNQNAA